MFVICFHASGSAVIATKDEGERKVFPFHTMKAYGWSKGTAPLILNIGP